MPLLFPIHNKKGFSLVEVMVVVVVISLIVAIGTPQLLRAKIFAHEMIAKSTVKSVLTALENFRIDQPVTSYPADLTNLSVYTPPYLNVDFQNNIYGGYRFYYSVQNASIQYQGANLDIHPEFSLFAVPLVPGITGQKSFYLNQSGVIYTYSGTYSAPNSYVSTAPSNFTPI